MNFNADDLEEQMSLDRANYARSKKKKGPKNEYNISKRKVRSQRKRRTEISIGDSRGRRKRFLSAFGGRPSMAKQRGNRTNPDSTKGRTRQRIPRV